MPVQTRFDVVTVCKLKVVIQIAKDRVRRHESRATQCFSRLRKMCVVLDGQNLRHDSQLLLEQPSAEQRCVLNARPDSLHVQIQEHHCQRTVVRQPNFHCVILRLVKGDAYIV